MRPLRCSMRPGFQGRSKWKRSVQCAWKFRPSRAASVASRMRSGSFAGSVLKRRWISLRRAPLVRPSITSMRSSARSVPSMACSRIVLQVALRALAVLGEDQDAAVVPLRRRAPRRLAEGRQVRAEVLADPVDEPADLGVGQVPRLLGDLLHPVEQRLLAAPERFGGGVARRLGLGGRGGGLDLGGLLGLELLGRPLAALVVGVGRRGEELPLLGRRLRRASAAAACPFSHCRSTVARWTLRLRAKASIDERRRCCRPTTSSPAAACARREVLAKRSSRAVRYSSSRRDSTSSGASAGRPSMATRSTIALREAALDVADVLLETAHHDVLERLLAAHLDAAREAVRVEQLEQRREAVRVAVVRRRREEEAVLEAAGEVADRARELRLDAVAPAARGRGVVGLVEDQQAPGQQRPEPLAHRVGVGRVDQEVVRDEEAAVRAPRVHAEAALAAHPRQVGAVEDLEHEAEALLELGLPLLEHRRRRRDDDRLGLLAQEQLARDQAGLDRLAEAGVVGDEEVDARQAQRLAQRLHLVGVDLDAGAERRLEEVRVGGRDAVPAQRVEEGGELARGVEALGREILPALLLEDPAVELVVPEDVERLALGVVVGAGEPDEGGLAGSRPATTSSTSQRRERTWTSSPTSGARSGNEWLTGAVKRSVLLGSMRHGRAEGQPVAMTSPRQDRRLRQSVRLTSVDSPRRAAEGSPHEGGRKDRASSPAFARVKVCRSFATFLDTSDTSIAKR